MTRAPRPLLFAATAFGLAAPAFADVPIPGTGLSVGGQAQVMSDYRFRGVSRSDQDPAVQANVTVSHDSGFYVGARATSLDGIDNFRLRELGDAEVDLYAGYSRDMGGGLTLDGGVMVYTFAGGTARGDYVEPYASLSYMLGPVEATAGAKYAPSQSAIGDEDMLYVFGELEAGIPFTPLTVRAHLGRQDWGAFGTYTNWSLGGSYTLGPAELGIRYVDTDLPSLRGQDGTVVASLSFGF